MVIADLRITNFNGRHFIKEVKKLPCYNAQKIRFLGIGEGLRRQDILKTGFDEYLSHFAGISKLIKAVESLLEDELCAEREKLCS